MKSLYRLIRTGHRLLTEWQMFPLYWRLIGRLCPIKLEVPDGKREAVILSFDVETLPNAGNRRELSMEYDDFIPRLLDVLDSFSVKAQFFVCGKIIEYYPELFRNMIRKGHSLGGHGYMHERLISFPYHVQRRIISYTKLVAKRLLGKELISWRSPQLASNFSTYKALKNTDFKISSTTTSKNPILINGILEIPVTKLDGDIVGYDNPRHRRYWIESMKNTVASSKGTILVFDIHTWLQMKYDFKLEGLQEFLSWIASMKEEVWIGNLHNLLVHGT